MALAAAAGLVPAGVLAAGGMVKPRFTADGQQMMRPEGYRRWVFVGANYGMGYTEGETIANAQPKPSTFHNIYVQAEALDAFAKTGVYPDGTMLVMEVVKPGTHASINKNGFFQDRVLGIEAGVKDSKRFGPGKWAYFKFFKNDGEPVDQAKAYPKDACWNCHNEHGAADNTFAQFYPGIRAVRPEVGNALKTVKSAH